MFSFFKDIWESPPIQDGQKLHPDVPIEKPVASPADDDERLTEEGFVRVERSSFLFSATQSSQRSCGLPASQLPGQSAIFASQAAYSGGLSPAFSDRAANDSYVGYGQPIPTPDNAEIVRSLPFVLHPNLRPHVSLYNPKTHETTMMRSNQSNIAQYNYDFDFERGVLRDINQQLSMRMQPSSRQSNQSQRDSWVKF